MAEKNQIEQIEKNTKSPPPATFVLFGAVTLWALPTAFFQVFSSFPWYDDEGYLMITVKQFVEGNILYDEVYTQYGAAYYFYKWLIHGLLNLPVTHNITRLTTLFVWILTSFLCGIFALRLTRSAVGGAAAYILTFLILFRMTYEPGHPQEFCGLLLIVSLLLLTGKNSGKSFNVRLGLLGATLSLLLLTKINLGLFLGLALAISFLSLSPRNQTQRYALIILTSLSALLPFVLFRNVLYLGWFRLSLLVTVGLSAILITSLFKMNITLLNLKHYLITLIGLYLTIFGIVLIVHLQGSTLEAFLNGIFFQPLKFGDIFSGAPPIHRIAFWWAVFAFLSAVAFLYFQKKMPDSAIKFAALLKFLFGTSVILSSFLNYYYFYFLNVFVLLNFATPFLWILLLNLNLREAAEQTVFPRITLVLAAILQPLQIFPIAGTQMNFGAFLMLIIAVVCLFDAAAELKITFPKTFSGRHLQTIFAVGLMLILAGYAGYRTLHIYKIYQSQIPLSFSGAEFIRLPEQNVALYNFLVENIKNNCDDFITLSGIYSLNFWTQIEPPTTYNTTALLELLSNEQQQAIVRKMQSSPRGCAVTHHGIYTDNKNNTNPLLISLRENYKKAAELRDYRFLFSSGNVPVLTYYAKFPAGEPEFIEFRLPPDRKGEISGFQIYDWEKKQILADSQKQHFSLINSPERAKNLPLLQDNTAFAGQTFRLQYSSNEQINPSVKNNLLLRLLNSDGKLIASLPFISE